MKSRTIIIHGLRNLCVSSFLCLWKLKVTELLVPDAKIFHLFSELCSELDAFMGMLNLSLKVAHTVLWIDPRLEVTGVYCVWRWCVLSFRIDSHD